MSCCQPDAIAANHPQTLPLYFPESRKIKISGNSGASFCRFIAVIPIR
jgi:hypothetical protein